MASPAVDALPAPLCHIPPATAAPQVDAMLPNHPGPGYAKVLTPAKGPILLRPAMPSCLPATCHLQWQTPCHQLTYSTHNFRVAPCMGQGLAMLRFFPLPRRAAWPALMLCHACAGPVPRHTSCALAYSPVNHSWLTHSRPVACRSMLCVWHPQLPCHPETGWPCPRLP